MSGGTDSFIDEVSEAVRRDRLALWARRYGWIAAVVVLGIVGAAVFVEWREGQARAGAQLGGEALLAALELPDPEARVEALSDLPARGEDALVGNLLLGAEQEASGQLDAARGTYQAVAADESVPPLYRDLASLKALMIAAQDPEALEADRQGLEALAAPGAPFRLLARETLANAELAAGNRGAALEQVNLILEDAEVPPSQRARVEALQLALAVPPAPEAATPAEAPAVPAVEAPAIRAVEAPAAPEGE